MNFVKDDSVKFQKNLERTERAINRITHQVEGIMDFVRYSPLDIVQCSLLEICKSALMGIPLEEEIKINLPTNDVNVLGDKIKLESLMYNLIINAVQSTNNQQPITIRFTESNDTVTIDVEDQGTPIPDDIKEKIFEPLFTTKQSGTGLGLVSCKNIVEQHKGTISVRNDPVTFTIVLPLSVS